MAQDLVGQSFGRWTILENYTVHSDRKGLAQCLCGTVKKVNLDSVKRGLSESCGCLRRELYTKGDHRLRLGSIWRHMKSRCYNPGNSGYSNYGGRGISICPEWLNSLDIFQAWGLANGYADNLSIDRIDNNKGYSPDNCRWTTSLLQAQHTRRVKMSPAKLALVLVLHEAGKTNRWIGRKLNVAHSCAGGVIRGETWGNLTRRSRGEAPTPLSISPLWPSLPQSLPEI